MSQVPTATAGSVSASEKSARSSVSPSASASTSAPASVQKLRSCVVCRSRKVRCDKLSPCSNCRRANIACVFPTADRPPRWARRLERVPNTATSSAKPTQEIEPDVSQLKERVHYLEGLVKEMSGQLEHADISGRAGSSRVNSTGSSTHDRDADHQMDTSSTVNATELKQQFGRLILQDASRSRYVSSGFWSRVNDEVGRPTDYYQARHLDWLSS